jgi:hypothetical protein
MEFKLRLLPRDPGRDRRRRGGVVRRGHLPHVPAVRRP